MVASVRILIVVAAACGGATPKTQPPELDSALDNMKMYEPFAMRDDARRPTQAIILGTDPKGGSTVIKLAGAKSEASADAMGVRLRLTTAPNTDGQVHVGTYEDRPASDEGTQWRAGVWVAALVAANTIGKDPTDFTFSVSSSGDIDGPSASALIAAGFLATMTGTPIDPTATLAGTIQVDGTIGPAAKLADKFEAALAAGAKKLGYPTGMRVVHTSATVKVDLVEIAKARGAVAVEVGDIRDAYQLLTGKTLVAPLPVAATEMAIEASTSKALEGKLATWRAQIDARRPTLDKIRATAGVPPEIATLARSVQDLTAKSTALQNRGAMAAAYARLVNAQIYAAAAADSFEVWSKLQSRDLAGARASLAEIERLDPNRGLHPVAALKPTTIGGHIQVMSAFQSALRGWGYGSLALYFSLIARGQIDNLDASKPNIDADLIAKIITTQLLRAGSAADTAATTDRLEYETVKSLKYMCSLPNVRRLTTAFRAASAAGVRYVDALVVEPLAARSGLTVDDARVRVAATEPKYVIAYALSRIDQMVESERENNPSLTLDLLLLAATERAYLDSVQLATKLYALDESRYANKADREAALARMLDGAERATRMHARAALVATGDIPIQSKLSYQLAGALRDGDFEEKVHALVSYWAAASYAQTTVMLARN